MQPATTPSRSRLLFALLYLGEGAPIGFVWWALPTWLRVQGLPVDQITGLTSLLVLPWVLKFLWAPLLDFARGNRGGLRAWIITAQLLMGGTLLPIIWLDALQQFNIIRLLLVAHAFAAATQDVAVDALALRLVPERERGRLNGAMQAGMLVGRSVFGGGALVLSAYLGWPIVIIALAACVWTSLIAVAFVREPEIVLEQTTRRNFWPVGTMAILKRPTTWLGFAFAVTAGAAFEAAGVLCGPMLVDHGFSQQTVGWLLGIPVVAATITGGLLGGFLADRFGHGRVVTAGILGFSAMVLVLAGVDWTGWSALPVYVCALTAFYFCIGVFTAASYALFMDLSRPPLAATQFSAFMAATNGCEAWAGWTGGRIVAASGYSMAFVAMTVVSLLSIALVKPIRKFKHPDN
jgi:MFS transporter, PAT family, beta-lactamase induction signal transducer AmpG